MQNYVTNFRQRIPNFTARFSVIFKDVEAPGNDSGKH